MQKSSNNKTWTLDMKLIIRWVSTIESTAWRDVSYRVATTWTSIGWRVLRRATNRASVGCRILRWATRRTRISSRELFRATIRTGIGCRILRWATVNRSAAVTSRCRVWRHGTRRIILFRYTSAVRFTLVCGILVDMVTGLFIAVVWMQDDGSVAVVDVDCHWVRARL